MTSESSSISVEPFTYAGFISSYSSKGFEASSPSVLARSVVLSMFVLLVEMQGKRGCQAALTLLHALVLRSAGVTALVS